MNHKGHARFWKEVQQGIWEPETFKVLDRFCTPGSTFIDIGAWNGVCSLYAASKGAVCHAIEPDEVAYKALRRNIGLNPDYDITPHRLAITSTNGTAWINTGDKFGDSMSSTIVRGEVEAVDEIDSLTLDRFIDNIGLQICKIGLIKIDIEGGEISLLKQAREFLSHYKPNIYISLHPSWFQDYENDMAIIETAFFSIYTVTDIHGTVHRPETFRDALIQGLHSFILTA